MSDGRADRLRQRRQEREQSERDGGADTDGSTDLPDSSDLSDSDEGVDWRDGPLKEVGTEVRMYLPDDVVDELDYHYTGFQREIKHKHGIAIEKNRHWYPLVAELGLESLIELDPAELLKELQEREYLSS